MLSSFEDDPAETLSVLPSRNEAVDWEPMVHVQLAAEDEELGGYVGFESEMPWDEVCSGSDLDLGQDWE